MRRRFAAGRFPGNLFRGALCALLLAAILNVCAAQQRDIDRLAAITADTISKSAKKTIAVVDFTDLQGNVTELGRYIAEELSVALAIAAKGFEVVDRTHLRTMLQEYKLNASGLIDPATARKLGQITGVEALVTGTITPFGDSVRLVIKTLDVQTAKITGAASGDFARTKAIDELLSRTINSPSGARAQEPARQPSATDRSRIQTFQGFAFELLGCRLQIGELTCKLKVTNSADRDRPLGFVVGMNRVFDDDGNEQRDQLIRFGARREFIGGVVAQQTMIPSVPVALDILFKGVEPNVTRLTVLEIGIWQEGRTSALQLRNVPVAR